MGAYKTLYSCKDMFISTWTSYSPTRWTLNKVTWFSATLSFSWEEKLFLRTKLPVLRRLLLVAFATAEDPLQRLLLHLASTVLTPPKVVKSWHRGGTTFQSKCTTTVLRGYQRLRRLSTHMDAVTKLREKHIDVKKGQKRPLEPAAALLLLLLLEQ